MRLFVSKAARPRRALFLAVFAIGCSGGLTGTEPIVSSSTLTADASTKTAYITLGDDTRIVTGADTTSATGWDIALNATNVTLNVAGGVTAFCLCANESATDAAILSMTGDGQLGAFSNVAAAQIPAASSFTAEAFVAHKWYRYNLTGSDHQIWPTFDVYLIKRGTSVYKLQLTSYYGPTGASRQITLRSAQLRS